MIIGEFEVVDRAAVKARMSLFFSLGKVPLRNGNACVASQNQTIYFIHSDELSNEDKEFRFQLITQALYSDIDNHFLYLEDQ